MQPDRRISLGSLCTGLFALAAAAQTTVLPEELQLRGATSPFVLRMTTGVAPFYLYDAPWGPRTRYWDDQFHRYYDSEEGPDYVVAERFDAALPRFERYCAVMAALGCNAIMLGDVIHLVTFDRLVPGDPWAVYGEDSPLRRRHDYYRAYFRKLIGIAAGHGLAFYVYADEFMYTEPLRAWIGEIEADNDRLWAAYRAKYDELLETLPDLAGVVLRFGELYPTAGYGAADIVGSRGHDPARFRRLITETWEVVCKQHGKTYVHRTWSLGLDSITGQAYLYDDVWRGLPTEGIYVSVKHPQTDFWYFNPMNPTLGLGAHRQIMEVQTRREYYGMGFFPSLPWREFRESFRFAARRGNVEGYWLWPNEGGGNNGRDLRPQAECITYIAGFGAWNEANTYLAAALGIDPGGDVHEILTRWATVMYGEAAAANVVRILELSDRVTEAGWHISDYAKRHPWRPEPTVLWFRITAKGFDPYKAELVPAAIARMDAEGREAHELALEQLRLFEAVEAEVEDRELARQTTASLVHQAALLALVRDWRSTALAYFQARVRGGAELFTADGTAGDAGRYLAAYQDARRRLAESLAHYDEAHGLYDTRDVHAALRAMDSGTFE